MRVNIEIDDELLREAMRTSGKRTKQAAIEAGLRMLVAVQSQARIRRLPGKVKWDGELSQSRLGRNIE